MPTEEPGETGERLRNAGGEFGATTGRPRRCGWLDMVGLKYSMALNGVDVIALTKLDVLSEMPEIKVCAGYEYDGKRLEIMQTPPTPSKSTSLPQAKRKSNQTCRSNIKLKKRHLLPNM